MYKKERRKYIFAQLESLPNAFQYVEVRQYIEDLEQQLKKKDEVINKAVGHIKVCTSSSDDYENFLSSSETKELLQILEDKEV